MILMTTKRLVVKNIYTYSKLARKIFTTFSYRKLFAILSWWKILTSFYYLVFTVTTIVYIFALPCLARLRWVGPLRSMTQQICWNHATFTSPRRPTRRPTTVYSSPGQATAAHSRWNDEIRNNSFNKIKWLRNYWTEVIFIRIEMYLHVFKCIYSHLYACLFTYLRVL